MDSYILKLNKTKSMCIWWIFDGIMIICWICMESYKNLMESYKNLMESYKNLMESYGFLWIFDINWWIPIFDLLRCAFALAFALWEARHCILCVRAETLESCILEFSIEEKQLDWLEIFDAHTPGTPQRCQSNDHRRVQNGWDRRVQNPSIGRILLAERFKLDWHMTFCSL